MNEHDIREMVRESIARHRGDAGQARRGSAEPGWSGGGPEAIATSAAFVRLSLLRGGDDDGNCIIEPAVRCNHCGYCQSYGH